MTTKEKIIRQSLKEATEERNKLHAIVFDTPLSQALALERDTIETAKNNFIPGSKECLTYLDKQLKEKDRLIGKAYDQVNNSNKYIDRMAKLDIEIGDLSAELHLLGYKKGSGIGGI